jgi:prophage regulatory protein
VATALSSSVSIAGESILRLPQVKERTALSRSSIYGMIKAGSFPKQVSLGPRAVGFLRSEIDAWIGSRISASRQLS